jgi:hypothetical protein
MIENVTNLTNTTSCVGVWRGFLLFLSDYWQGLSALAALITTISVVIGLFFRWYLQKKQHIHEKEMEKLRQDYDEKIRQQPILAAINLIISRLEQFVSCWGELKKSGDKAKLRKQMTEIGNELKIEVKYVEKNLMSFPQDSLKKTNAIADEITIFSKMRGVITVGHDSLFDLTGQLRIKKVVEGNKLVERVKEFIGELQQEGEEEKGGKEDE